MKIIIFGIQGSGKSTQAALLADYYHIPHIQTGDLLRSYGQTPEGKSLKEALNKGQLSPTSLVVKLLKERLKKQDCKTGFILDGYPRNFEQYNSYAPQAELVFFISISDSEAMKRLLLRGREDDTRQAIVKRLELYHKETKPVLEIYKDKGILEEVDGERSVETIHDDLVKLAERRLG